MDEFARLYRENYQRVFAYLRTLYLDYNEAEDVADEAFLKAAQAFDRFDPSRAQFSTWVITIARNCVFSRKRKEGRELFIEDTEANPASETVEDYYPSLDEHARMVSILLQELSEEERELVHLKYYEDLPNTQIALLLSMNPSTVSTRLARAMAKMRKVADKQGFQLHGTADE